jgi:SAM-dependent methyltransferase
VNSTTHIGASSTNELSELLKEIPARISLGQSCSALNSLSHSLTQVRSELTSAAWRIFCSQKNPLQAQSVARILKEGPLSNGCGLIHQPRLLDLIYGTNASMPRLLTPLAHAVRQWELSLGLCETMRARRACFARELESLIAGSSIKSSQRILAVGCGHLRDAAEALKLDGFRDGEIVAFDRDRACVDLIEREYEHAGLQTVSGSLREWLGQPAAGTFDFIYVPTLFDMLPDVRIEWLIDSLLGLLRPGGRLLAANFAPEVKEAAYFEAWLDWWPIYRTEEDLAALLSGKANRNLRGQAIFRDETEGSIFVDLQLV